MLPYRVTAITRHTKDNKLSLNCGGGEEIGERARREDGGNRMSSRVPVVSVVVVVAAETETNPFPITQPLTSAASVPTCARTVSSDDRGGLRRRHR